MYASIFALLVLSIPPKVKAANIESNDCSIPKGIDVLLHIHIHEDFVDIVRETLKEKTLQLSMIEVTEEQFISSCNIYVDWFKDQMALFTSLSMSAI